MNRLIALVIMVICMSCKSNYKVNYKYIGSYKYEIFDDSLFKDNSYLSPDSYGYVIGDLDFNSSGIKLLNINNLNPNDEYILTMNHPIEKILMDSDLIKGEGQEHIKKIPLDIRLNQSINSDSIYIYKLKPKGKYRLLLP